MPWLWVWSSHGQEVLSAPQGCWAPADFHGCSAPFTVEHWRNLLGWSHGFFLKPPNQTLLRFIHSFIIIAINSPYEQKINRASKHFQGIIGCHPIITQKDWMSGFEITRSVAFFYWDGSSKTGIPMKSHAKFLPVVHPVAFRTWLLQPQGPILWYRSPWAP